MAINFPDSPSAGEVFIANGVSYTYSSDGYWMVTGTAYASGTTPNLQNVTDEGDTTTNAINSGNPAAGESNNGAGLDPSGRIFLQRSTAGASNAVLIARGGTTENIKLYGNGNATFTGDVTSNGYLYANGSGGYLAVNRTGTTDETTLADFSADSTQKIEFKADGSATFTGAITAPNIPNIESGTWTPRLNGWEEGNGNYRDVPNSTTKTPGVYQKIGDQVTVQIIYEWDSMIISDTRPWYIYDLPFNKKDGGAAAGSIGRFEGCTDPELMCFFTEGSTSQFYIMNHDATKGPNGSRSNPGKIYLSMTYQADT